VRNPTRREILAGAAIIAVPAATAACAIGLGAGAGVAGCGGVGLFATLQTADEKATEALAVLKPFAVAAYQKLAADPNLSAGHRAFFAAMASGYPMSPLGVGPQLVAALLADDAVTKLTKG
jgi:hypothetical protein